MSIAEFLLARIAEDEDVAQYALSRNDGGALDYGGQWFGAVEHARRWEPARVVAECEAKRAYIERHERCGDGCGPCDEYGPAHLYTICDLRFLAAVHAGHPDYREEWKP